MADAVTSEAASGAAAAKPSLEITSSRQFPEWLAERRASIAFTTYQAGKVFLIGLREDRRLSVFERTFERSMGLCAHGRTLWLASLYQLWRFDDTLDGQVTNEGYDALYVPRLAYTTGDLDVHDVCVAADGRPVLVNTLFGCLARPSETHSFQPLWRPPFVSRLAAEDRCHLNGLAMADGKPAYVTAAAESDIADAWRDRRRDGGVIVRVADGAVVATGLSMPHSPRVWRGRLWVLNSGAGELGHVDQETRRFTAVAFCPGYLRGLDFIDEFAVVGCSKQRENRTFSGLTLDERLARENAGPRCAIYVVDMRTGDVVHWLRIEGVIRELYDVAMLHGVRRPSMLGFKTDEIRRVISIGPEAAPGA
ncbi:MAG TPA: TIGR03032 family protein [Alphaproteobacteria bacterium]|nr:TIGR03032 family protein [Alphaproteobacteria bacterium]